MSQNNTKQHDKSGSNQYKEQDKNVFFETVISTRRVVKVVKGGRIFSFSTLVIIGDKNGSFGIGTGKALESMAARKKAVAAAKKSITTVNTRAGRTLPHATIGKFGQTTVIIKPALPGNGIVAGGSVRELLEAIGLKDVVAKIIGSSNPHSSLLAAHIALSKLRSLRSIAASRGKTIKEVLNQKDKD